MTVISTIISRHCIAHASDSLITRKNDEGKYEVLDQKTTKIICIRRWAGIIACWGLSRKDEYNWSVLKWLQAQVDKASQFETPEAFANYIGITLNQKLSRMVYKEPIHRGIGIHFTAYEPIDGYLIPELFLITNFEDTSYKYLHPDGIRVTRETYGTAFNVDYRGPEHSQSQYRHDVRNFLQADKILLYNNGDPEMFNSAFKSVNNLFNIAEERRILVSPTDAKAHRDIVSWPIDLVSKMQRYFVKPGYQIVGGKLHNLSVTPRGEYESDTGDKC
jgi:hypothetical protein